MKWDNCSNVSKLENYFVQAGSRRLMGLKGETYYLDLLNEQDYLTAYNLCPPLKAIVGKRAKAFNTGKIEIVNKNTGNFARGGDAALVQKLLDRPNVLQSRSQFMAQNNIYVDIFGYCPIMVTRPVGMDFDIPTSMWNIPPWLFDLEYTKQWLKAKNKDDVYTKFYMMWLGGRVELDLKDVFFIFDDGIGTDDDQNLVIPDSKLLGLEYPISNTIAAYKSRNTLITKRGAVGILSNDGKDQAGIVPLKEGEKEIVQDEFKKYGIVGQPYQVIVTDAALKWQQMGFPTKDLMLFEEIQDNIERLCDAYDWPVELMSRQKGVTYANKAEAMKQVYRDSIIPEAESRLQMLEKAILGEDSNLKIQYNFEEVEVLQEDKKSKAEARRAMNQALQIEYDKGLITKNDWREMLGLDRIAEPGFDEYKMQQSLEQPTIEEQDEDEDE